MPSTALRVRLEPARGPPQEAALALDRAADGAVALRMQCARPLEPVRRGLRAVGEERARLRGIARRHLDVALERRVAELREPEPVLLDEVDCEPVAARRDWAAHRDLLAERRTRFDRPRERGADAVPDDRVAALVQPVVGEVDPVARAARPPRCRAGVLGLDNRRARRARLHRRQLERMPAHYEGAGGRHRATLERVTEPLLVRVARREPVERTPVWFMRQAGRSLPEYRALRERYGFFELASMPELCAEVTLQPVRRHGVDAAVLFADIMTPVLGMGIGVDLVEGVGPVVDLPIESMAGVERLSTGEPDENVLAAIRIVRRVLESDRALVGFCGGPFTVAGYLVEGKPSRDFARTKTLMYREPAVWHALMERLTEQFSRYVAAVAEAGADAIQLFDSWVGVLSVSDYREFVAPYSARILAAAGVPTIHFGTGTTPQLLAEMAQAGGSAVGVDSRIRLDEAWTVVGEERGVQGN